MMRPTSTPQPSEVVETALPESGNTVFRGRYTTHFKPALMLTIDRQVDIDCAPGYQCRGDVDVNSEQWLDMEFGHDHPIEISMMRFSKVFDPAHSGKEMDPPVDLARWLTAFPGVAVLARDAATVGGVAVTQLDVRTGSENVALGPTGLVDLPSLGFGAHQLRRVILLSKSGEAIVIGLGSLNPADDTEARLADAGDILQPIVDSITWQ